MCEASNVSVTDCTRDGQTALHLACVYLQPATPYIIHELVRRGAAVDVFDKSRNTPMMLLFNDYYEDPEDSVKALVECGAGVDLVGASGTTALYLACQSTVKVTHRSAAFLIKLQAAVNVQTNQCKTPLHAACANCFISLYLVQLLVVHGACVNTADNDGNTPLLVACSRSNFEAVKFLLDNGADIHAKHKKGATAMYYVCGSGSDSSIHTEVVYRLLESGAPPGEKDKNGQTPLHYACRVSNHVTVEALTRFGADVNAIDYRGHSPLYELCDFASQPYLVAKILLQNGAGVNHSEVTLAFRRGLVSILHKLVKEIAKRNGLDPGQWLLQTINYYDLLPLQERKGLLITFLFNMLNHPIPPAPYTCTGFWYPQWATGKSTTGRGNIVWKFREEVAYVEIYFASTPHGLDNFPCNPGPGVTTLKRFARGSIRRHLHRVCTSPSSHSILPRVARFRRERIIPQTLVEFVFLCAEAIHVFPEHQSQIKQLFHSK